MALLTNLKEFFLIFSFLTFSNIVNQQLEKNLQKLKLEICHSRSYAMRILFLSFFFYQIVRAVSLTEMELYQHYQCF